MFKKIKNKLFSIEEKGVKGKYYYFRFKFIIAKILLLIMTKKQYAKLFYRNYTGKKLNLKKPKYYDEKIWWLKFNYRNNLMTECADKIKVREYVKEKGYENILIPLIETFSDVKDIDLKKYRSEVVIKCNHNSGGHFFYDPFKKYEKKEVKYVIKTLKYLMKQNQYTLSLEWAYKNIKPQILVESIIRDKNGNLPLDYKFMCFDGVPKMLFLDLGLINEDKSYNHDYNRNIYDMDFKLIDVRESRDRTSKHVDKPKNFDLMVEVAKSLSEGFPHCRVDLYNVDGKIYFGEITFYHGSGCNNIEPESWDKKMGDWIAI